MKEIIKEAESLLEQVKNDVAGLEQILMDLRQLKERNHPDTFEDLNVS